MVNFHSPVTMAQEMVALSKLWHLVNGIFIWEFVTTLHFEWDYIRGHRPYRWTIWVYSIARLSMLSAVILNMVQLDVTSPMNCQAWITCGVLSAYTSFATASLLIVLRVIAVWNREKIIFVIAMAIWIADLGFLMNGLVRVRGEWSHEANACTVVNFETTKYTIFMSLVTDVLLLLIMLSGLLRMRLDVGSPFGLWRILWNQGLIWLFLATVAEVPSSTLMFLNLNDPLTLILQIPSNIIVTIAATRMYRLLMNFGPSEMEISLESLRGTARTTSETRVRHGPIQFNRTQVAVGTDGQYPTSQMSSGSIVSTEPRGRFKSQEVSLNVDVETGSEK